MTVIAIILVFLVFLVASFLGAMFSGWLLWLAWNNVVTGLFDNVNDISYWGAVLIMLVLNLIFGGAARANKD